MMRRSRDRGFAPWSLAIALGLGTIAWGTQIAIAPQVARAYTASVDISLDRQPEDTYQTFLRRAESAARAAAQRSFGSDILISQVSVVVVAENRGTIVPILKLDVSRDQWRSRPDPQAWATYYSRVKVLLDLEDEPSEEDSEAESEG